MGHFQKTNNGNREYIMWQELKEMYSCKKMENGTIQK